MNNLYLIKRKDEIGWDEYCGFVISAKTPREARQTASHRACDEGFETWLSSDLSSCQKIGTTHRRPGILLDSFNAG